MKKIIDLISEELKAAFDAAGYTGAQVAVGISNRPDLCEYQSNSAMAAAKTFHKAPMVIAEEVVSQINLADEQSTSPKQDFASQANAVQGQHSTAKYNFESQANVIQNHISIIASATACAPGFINIKVSEEFLATYLCEMSEADKFGCEMIGEGKKVVLDYGGPNVAKPLHIGHLRAAIIGESLKRIYRYVGYDVVGDVHLGDWGLQMGLIIEEVRNRKPDLPYFDENFTGEYPKEPPFSISDLEEIYPAASAKSKVDEEFAARAHEATARLQAGDRGYTAIFKHIINLSVSDLKKNYKNLNVDFDLWKGESDVQKYIPDMLASMEEKGVLRESEGAMVIDVAEEGDAKEIPPCLVKKSDGASLYATTDLATIYERVKDFNPDEILYVVDKRQAMHFVQVFRAARRAGIVPDKTTLFHLGFGTMNGKDGKPFKTREGGVMRLETLISDINEAVYNRIMENGGASQGGDGAKAGGANSAACGDSAEAEARANAKIIGLAALKYGDLSNHATKDYVFDIDKFSSFEGNTGPYILYTIVRIKSILRKYAEADVGASQTTAAKDATAKPGCEETFAYKINPANTPAEKALGLTLSKANDVIEKAAVERAPHKICGYIYEISNAFNSFYHETKILAETDEIKKAGYIALLTLTKNVLEACIDLLGFSAPERM